MVVYPGNKLIHLNVESYVGYALGASHYYGYLKGDVDDSRGFHLEVQLTHKLTSREATLLNRKAFGEMVENDTFKKGDVHPGFTTKQDVIDKALEVWQLHFPGALVLLLGESAYVRPKRVLASPDKRIQDGMNMLFDAFEVTRCDTPEKYRLLYEPWKALLDSLLIEKETV